MINECWCDSYSNLINVPPRLFSALSRVWQTWKLTIRKTFLLFYFCNVIGAIWNAWMRMSFIPNGARIAVSDVLYLKVSKSQKQFSWNSIAPKTNEILDKILHYEVDPFKEIDINFSSLEFKILTWLILNCSKTSLPFVVKLLHCIIMLFRIS